MQLETKIQFDVKWPNLVWSIVILFALTICSIGISRHGSYVPGLFGFFIVSWMVCLPAATIVLILRLLRIINRGMFPYVFSGVTCFYLGICGLFFGVEDLKRNELWVVLYGLTIALAIFILVDAFVLELPGIRKTKY
jgi:hypothetical protein